VAPESRIDRYVPEAQLGSCGPVATFRVRTQGDDRATVLKVLFADRVDKDLAEPLTKRFLAAGRRSQACSLATTAQIYEVSDDPKAPFVARQWIQGSSLDEIVRLGAKNGAPAGLDPIAAGLICADVASTLEAARTAPTPLFHLGLSPTNVIVTSAAEASVLDFAIAASVRWEGVHSADRGLYLAPELRGIQTVDTPAGPAHKADAFSLGALLYFLLTGMPPPAHVAAPTDLEQHLRQSLAHRSRLPDSLVGAVLALTSVDPQARPNVDKSLRDQLSLDVVSDSERRDYLAKALPTSTASAPLHAPSRTSHLPRMPVRQGPSAVALAKRRSPPAAVSLAALAFCSALAFGYYSLRTAGRTDRTSASTRSPSPAEQSALDAAVPSVAASPTAAPRSPEMDDTPTRVPGRLYLDTTPDQAAVWVDGVVRGMTPVDLLLGTGGHRVVVIRPGYLILRAVFDTTKGEYARRSLQRVAYVPVGDGVLDIQCQSADKYPILIDDEETGLLCPASRVRVPSGKHTVGVFIPPPGKSRAVEVEVPPGLKPKLVTLGD